MHAFHPSSDFAAHFGNFSPNPRPRDWSMTTIIVSPHIRIQHIDGIPQDIKDLYKTAWEISQKALINMSADRGAFICQSQSLNIFMENANFGKLTSMHFYGWKSGLKTGMYYLRTKSAVDAIKFTLDSKQKAAIPAVTVAATAVAGAAPAAVPVEPLSPEELKQMLAQSKESEDDDCLMCGS